MFLPTTAAAELASAYLANRGLSNNALHSRKSQGYRTRTSNEFRDADVARERQRVESGEVDAAPVWVKGLRKVYSGKAGGGQKVAINHVSFHIEQGECFGLLGANGAGKVRVVTASPCRA